MTGLRFRATFLFRDEAQVQRLTLDIIFWIRVRIAKLSSNHYGALWEFILCKNCRI